MIPLIIDCDPGIDDALALLLAAGSVEFELLAVTTVAGNRPVETTTANARRILDLAGREDVPVHAGCARPLGAAAPRCNLVHGEDGLCGARLPPTRAAAPGHAADLITATLMQSPPNTVTLVAVGPLTNLALAEIKTPGVLRRARSLVIMGGAAFCPGNITPAAEFNFHADPLAAHTVLAAGADVKLFGLDVTSKAAMSAEWIESLGALRTRCGTAAAAMLTAYAQADPLLHDACPVAWLLDPTLFAGQQCSVSVDWRAGPTEGQTLAWQEERMDKPFPPNARVFVDLRTDRVLELVRQRIARLP
ncbi:nucleoside hydrolase [Ramlibacter sp. WS9]|uniref:nucleoside hydrolase n=1 Tax=Ramlibacter sp. WS9 TaxID=1882741 RepID=UPI001142C854|nr:nucleoside hydrolase [Ramlibacter sp. WS9]ROZ62735.1 nucleoside hydrolase [Ramlibacter sp. WS9]